MKQRILIVEDESIVALDIQNRLENNDFQVVAIEANGSRALERALLEKPDLILMDINLKGSLDGIETASLITRNLDSPIIFLTAFADEKTLKRARISDASGYILKPFQEGELLITIELALKRDLLKKKIQKNNQWLYSTLNNINDAVITISNENRVVFFNEAAKKITENSINTGQIFNPESKIVKEGERTFFLTEENKIDVEYFKTVIKDEDSDVLGTVHYIRDITKQVEYEIVLEKARVAAENSNRSKNEFLANVTHELRTPLNTILGMNHLISEFSEDKEVSSMHDLIDKAAEKLLKQVNEILELSEIESGKLKIHNCRFQIQDIISEVVESFKYQATLKKIELSIISEKKIPLLNGDKNKIKHILSCLISNAVKFSKNGFIKIASSWSDNRLFISVEDNGIGLTKVQKELIFELFTQVDGSYTRSYGGTGLGLTLVNKLLLLLGGTIVVESKELSGSKFSIAIPVKKSSDQKNKKSDKQKEYNSTGESYENSYS